MARGRTELIQDVIDNLEDAGFTLSSQCDVRPSCFDLVARRGNELVLVKILNNIDALNRIDAFALQTVAHFFNATPIVVGQKTRRGELDSGVVYKRYGVTTITPTSLNEIIAEQKLPREFIQRGGRFVAIDGAKLRECRETHNMTKEELASHIEVSTRAILAYEKDEMDLSADVAEQLEKVLETDLIIPIDILSGNQQTKSLTQIRTPDDIPNLEKRVNQFFERLGMNVLWTDRAPFNLAAKEEGPPLMSGVGSLESWGLQKRMKILKSVSSVTESNAVIIVEEGKVDENVSDLPVIRRLELDSIEKTRDLKNIIKERSCN